MGGWRRRLARIASPLAEAIGAVGAALVRGLFAVVRLLGIDRATAIGGALARGLGPWLPVDRVGRANLAAAFPEKSEAERRAILNEAWDNLGRTVAEYPFLRDIIDYDETAPDRATRVEIVGAEHFRGLRDGGGPAIVFSAHLANWELAAVAAATYGLDATVVFRPPNNPVAERVVRAFRGPAMGRLLPSGQGVALAMAGTLERGGLVAMLADQHLTRGVVVPFFGRPALSNPVLAKLARRFDCPIHGARSTRLPGGRFRLEITPPITPPRDKEGQIDEAATTALIAQVIEGWVREAPGQWLWLHRRWRVPAAATPAENRAPEAADS